MNPQGLPLCCASFGLHAEQVGVHVVHVMVVITWRVADVVPVQCMGAHTRQVGAFATHVRWQLQVEGVSAVGRIG